MTSPTHPPAGWYPDPAGSGDERYWDGGNWSQVTRPARAESAPLPPAAGPSGPVLASWIFRVLAALLDAIVFMLPSFLVSSLIAGEASVKLQQWYEAQLLAMINGQSTGAVAVPWDLLTPVLWASVVTSVLFIIYRTVMVTLVGATVGQLVLRLRVVRDGDATQGKLSWGTSALRATLGVLFGQIPGLNLINGLMPLFNAKKQTLHDMAARTVVVKN